jgi:multidrug resistance efflux pump
MTAKRILSLAAVVLAAGGALFWFLSRRRPDELEFSGTIEARDAEVGSLVGGRIAAVEVDEGAAVKKGQILVRLESDLLDHQVLEQKGRVAMQQANLDRTVNGPRREEVARARATWENAERERRRLESLLKEGVIGQDQYDTAATTARTSKEAFDELNRGSRAEDIQQARASLESEKSALAYLLRQKEELTVRAPADGIIQSMDLRPGDLVAPNEGIVKILEPKEIWVRVYVPEPQLGFVQRGAPVTFTVDTFPHRTFSGKVVEIRPQSEYTPRNIQTLDQRGDQVFGVKVAIEPAPELKPGMAVLVRMHR